MDTNSESTILIVDDHKETQESLIKILQKEGYTVLAAESGEIALDIIRKRPVQVVVTDLRMPGMSGIDLLRACKAIAPEIEIVLISGYGTIETAVEAMKEGAYDFVAKPFKKIMLTKTIKKALEKQSLAAENRYLKEQIKDLKSLGSRKQVIGTSLAMRRVLEIVSQVASSSATVLIQGESGTGKEVIANALHYYSSRADKPFVKVSCAALPETLLEAELFGHERGAFTGAIARREGRFEVANGGTLFLDEIGEMSMATQVKLLRVLQEGEFERLGSSKTIKVDVRLVAATNVDLLEAIKQKKFREDLYYRLNVITLTLPPLRDRKEDIPLLAEHFLNIYREKNHKPIKGISKEAMDILLAYSWPGNVRELENTIERAVVLARTDLITLEELPENLKRAVVSLGADPLTPEELPENLKGENLNKNYLIVPLGTPLEEIELQVIHETLRRVKGDKNLAAKLLGIASRTIYRKLGELEKMDSPSEHREENILDQT